MHRTSVTALLGACALVACTAPVFAQGKSQGRALGAAARGSSAAGIAKANVQAPKAQQGLSRGNSSLNRATRSMQRLPAQPPSVGRLPAGERPLANQERILDHRLSQADHLRAVSEANGNEHLLDTADRMSEKAITNYERNTGLVYERPVAEAPPAEGEAAATATVAVRPDARRPAPKGFWFRSR